MADDSVVTLRVWERHGENEWRALAYDPPVDGALTVQVLDSICGLAMIGVLELSGMHREDAEADIRRLRAVLDGLGADDA